MLGGSKQFFLSSASFTTTEEVMMGVLSKHFLLKTRITVSEKNTNIGSMTEHVIIFALSIPLLPLNTHHLALGPEYWSEQKRKQAQG